jgi:hypothetical protein
MKFKFYSILFAIVAAVSFAGSAFAQVAESVPADALSYTYVQGAYQYDNINGANAVNTHGGAVNASVNLGTSPFFVVGSFDRLSDANAFAGGVDTYRLGAGLHVPLALSVDAYGTAGVLKTSVTAVDPNSQFNITIPRDFTTYGYDFEAGLRAALTDRIQVKGGVQEERLTRTSDWTTYGLGEVLFKVTNHVDLVGALRANQDDRILSGGVRVEL